MTNLTTTFAPNDTITASEVNTNFTDLITAAENIDNADLLGNITHDKLSDKHVPSWASLQLVPFTSGTNYGSPGEFGVSTSSQSIGRWRPIIRPGFEAYVSTVWFDVYSISGNGSGPVSYPFLSVRLNGSSGPCLGGTELTLNFDSCFWVLAEANPLTTPLVAMAEGDYLEFFLTRSAATGNPLIAGVNVFIGMRHVLIN